jgi:NADPH2:quinone reductase
MATMKVMAIDRFGGPEVFRLQEWPRPQPAAGEVLIEVHASSVNPVDYKIRDGRAKALAPVLPAVLNPDCAGVVVGVGEGVIEFALYDQVYAFANGLAGAPGALAEFMVADARLVAKMPSSLTFEQAAVLPLVSVTAWNCLVDQAGLRSDQSLLVQGGTGGVGHVAIQLARCLGAHVTASCGSEEKCELALALGADSVYNYRTTDPGEVAKMAPRGAGFDIVFNTPGQPAIDASVAATAIGGTILDILGDFPTQPGFQAKWLTFKSIFAGRPLISGKGREHVSKILNKIAKLVDDGQIKPLLDQHSFNFRDVGQAHAYAEHGFPTGKVVLLPNF